MTPEEINIAIAEACGWRPCEPCARLGYLGQWRLPDDSGCDNKLPDYLNDLNAMRAAEVALKDDDPHAYACYCSDFVEECGPDAISLSAAQRAEAFLKIIGKWEEAE